MKSFALAAFLFLTVNMHAQQDWANTAKYKSANAQLLSEGKKTKGRVVLIGDSITEFWLRENPEFFSGKPYINRGIGGQTTPQILMRFPDDVVALHPKMVVILAGTNDIAGNAGPMTSEMSMENIRKMIKLAKANKIKPVLCALPPSNEFPWRKGMDPADKIISFNAMLKQYAAKEKIPFVDYYTAMADAEKGLPKKFSNDGVHPNKAGYEVMGPLLEKSIKPAGKR